MKHLFHKVAALLTFLCVLTSCGGDKSNKISTSRAEVAGNFAEYFSVLQDQSPKLTVDYGDERQKFRIQIKLKLDKVTGWTLYQGPYGKFFLDFLDQDGYPIEPSLEMGAYHGDRTPYEKLNDFMKQEPGTVVAFPFYLDLSDKKQAKELEAKYAKYDHLRLRFMIVNKKDDTEEPAVEANSDDSYYMDRINQDFDKLYELAEKLTDIYKRRAKGEISLSDASLLEEISNLEAEIQSYADHLTSQSNIDECTLRYFDVIAKFGEVSKLNVE